MLMAESVFLHRTVSLNFFLRMNEVADVVYYGSADQRICNPAHRAAPLLSEGKRCDAHGDVVSRSALLALRKQSPQYFPSHDSFLRRACHSHEAVTCESGRAHFPAE